MGNISNSTGDRYKDLIECINGELEHLSKKQLLKYMTKTMWGKSFQYLDTILEQLIEARVDKECKPECGEVVSKHNLIGRQFRIHSKGAVYTIEKNEGDEGRFKVSWATTMGSRDCTTYTIGACINNIDKGSWFLIEE